MKRASILIVALALLLSFSAAARAQDPNNVTQGTLTAGLFGSPDLVGGFLGYRPTPRTELQLRGFWLDGLGADQSEGWGLLGVGTYDLIQDADMVIMGYHVPTTIYAGVGFGFIDPLEEGDTDATASLVSGVTFGDQRLRLGFEFQYWAPQTWWAELADVPEDTRVLATLAYRFR